VDRSTGPIERTEVERVASAGPGRSSSTVVTSAGGSPTAVLFVIILGTLMAAVDTTIVVLALPTMGTELKSPLGTIIWVILLYLLVATLLSTQFGRIGDIFGRARLYTVGFGIFTVASVLCGLAPSDTFLIASRAGQAVGASFMLANSGAIIADHFPPERRGRAYGYTSLGWNLGAILGIVLGGAITTFLGWRFIFFVNAPIGVAAVWFGHRYVRDVERHRTPLDLPGFGLLGAALGAIAYGAIDFASYGVRFFNEALLVMGLILLVPFFYWERRAKAPMLDLALFRRRILTFSLVSSFLQGLGYLAVVFLMTMYLQGVRGLSPLNAALLLVPGYVVGGGLAPLMGRITDRLGARLLATLGVAFLLAGVLLYASLRVNSPLEYVVGITLVTGVGGGMFWPANNAAIMANAPRGSYGAVSGLRSMLANTGTLLSFVLAISIASATVPRYVAYEVILGTTKLIGGVGSQFLVGIDGALYVSAAILASAAILSALRGPHLSRGSSPAESSRSAP
jgi:EmrB/QacA subfamily drug resistance transporter